MRTKAMVVGAAGMVAAVLAGCGGDATGASAEADGTMTAHVADTGRWTADKSVIATLQGGELVMTGTSKRGPSVKITVDGVVRDPADPDKVQTFTLSGFSATAFGFATYSEGGINSFGTNTTGGSGTITITRLTETRAVGTFVFVAVRANIVPGGPGEQDLFRRLSEGTFDVRLR